jgi:hypothetical protein
MHVFTFSYEKISLGNNERQWVVDCVRQPRKNNGQFDLPCEGGKSEIGSLHGLPALEKRTFILIYRTSTWDFVGLQDKLSTFFAAR